MWRPPRWETDIELTLLWREIGKPPKLGQPKGKMPSSENPDIEVEVVDTLHSRKPKAILLVQLVLRVRVTKGKDTKGKVDVLWSEKIIIKWKEGIRMSRNKNWEKGSNVEERMETDK